jgi:predicted GIY-YIG superfamily endonuclease
MRGQRATLIEKRVLNDMYNDADFDSKKKRRAITGSKKFKAVYRAAKKNYLRDKNKQTPLLKNSKRKIRIEKSKSKNE